MGSLWAFLLKLRGMGSWSIGERAQRKSRTSTLDCKITSTGTGRTCHHTSLPRASPVASRLAPRSCALGKPQRRGCCFGAVLRQQPEVSRRHRPKHLAISARTTAPVHERIQSKLLGVHPSFPIPYHKKRNYGVGA